MKKRKICILSGRFPDSKFKAYINHKIYCDIHGYTYIYCNWPTKARNPYMNKIEYIKHYYEIFDYIFWIDDDAFFINMDISLNEYIPDKRNFLSICSSPDYKNIHTFISSGQFMIKCSDLGRKFIDEIGRTDLKKIKDWWNESLGYFTNGDQDAMVFLLKEKPEFKHGFKRYNYKKFNSRIHEIINGGDLKDVFILHITGTKENKHRDYLKLQHYLNRSPSLVDKAMERNYFKRDISDIKWKFIKKIFGT